MDNSNSVVLPDAPEALRQAKINSDNLFIEKQGQRDRECGEKIIKAIANGFKGITCDSISKEYQRVLRNKGYSLGVGFCLCRVSWEND